ncbi:MAG: C40 family peptidase [Bacteroidetes bacterium]|nr:C40 family peptidase [Bacteroidota bacterium]
MQKILLFFVLVVMISACGNHQKLTTEKGKPSEINRLNAKYHDQTGVVIHGGKTLALYTTIDHLIGTPYCWGGTTKKCFDCSGFVSLVYKEVYGIPLARTADVQYDECHRVRKKRLKEGDLVFFHTEKGSRKVTHVGIYLGSQKFVHASTSKGVRIDSLDDDYYQKTWKGGGRKK